MTRIIAVIDCETDPFKIGRIPHPFLWGYYNGSEYHQFDTCKQLANFISERDEIIYAHNGGKFDFHYLLDYLEPYDDIMLIHGRIAQCRIGMAELRDSYCILPVALSAYKKDEIDYSIFEKGARNHFKNRNRIERYLKSDCVYLWEMVTEFNKDFGPQLTLAGAAMKRWLKISNEPCEETDDEFYKQFASFYYGGRVECFRRGVIDVDFSVFDINSAYPKAMLEKHPYSNNCERSNTLLHSADFVKVRCISNGALPWRDKSGLSFPRDGEAREYTITKWEFDAAMETDSLRRVKILGSYRFMKHTTFEPYINHFWEKRQRAIESGNVLDSLFCKLMMNSLYGKFAANPDAYHNFMIVPGDKIAVLKAGHKGWKFGGEIGPWLLAQKALEDCEKRYYNVATGASITGYVRAMLWRAIYDSEGVLYVDTDSIACERKGRSIKIGVELGEWKNEGNFDKAGIGGKKLYIFRGSDGKGNATYKTASKGARLTNAELWRIARGGEVLYEREVPTYSVTKPLDPLKSFVKRKIVNTAILQI